MRCSPSPALRERVPSGARRVRVRRIPCLIDRCPPRNSPADSLNSRPLADGPHRGCDTGGMPVADFAHLRLRTAYLLSAGAIRIKELADLCKAEQMPTVAITDSGNLFGALEFATTCSAAGVQPIIGCDIAVERGT